MAKTIAEPRTPQQAWALIAASSNQSKQETAIIADARRKAVK